jgi:hypothetical protein
MRAVRKYTVVAGDKVCSNDTRRRPFTGKCYSKNLLWYRLSPLVRRTYAIPSDCSSLKLNKEVRAISDTNTRTNSNADHFYWKMSCPRTWDHSNPQLRVKISCSSDRRNLRAKPENVGFCARTGVYDLLKRNEQLQQYSVEAFSSFFQARKSMQGHPAWKRG